jgi:polar amino acid transport system substrate-binding protein
MMKHRIAAAALVLAISSLALTACSTSSTNSSKTPTQGSTADAQLAKLLPARYKSGINVASGVYAPMEFLDSSQKFTGFDYDLGQALGAKLGTKLTFTNQDFNTIIPSLQSGTHQIIMYGMNDTATREQVLDFVDYFKAGLGIIVQKGNPQKITTVQDLCGKSVAVAKGTTQEAFVQSESAKCASGSIAISELPTEGDALLAVRAGKAVADVEDAAPAAYDAKTAGGGSQFEVVFDPKNPNGYAAVYTGIGILKKDHDLAVAMQAALKSLIADGTYGRLLQKYNLSSYGVKSAILYGAS